MKKNVVIAIYVLLGMLFLVLLIVFPKTAVYSAEKGLIICAKIIIPSLFPIYFCVIFIMKLLGGTVTPNFKKLIIFIFSLLGGYPTGAKLIDEEYKAEAIDLKTARKMQSYCVNAGIGFIISAVGYNIFGSKKIGFLLFISHFSASFLLFLFLGTNREKCTNKKRKQAENNIADIFVISVSEAANTVLSICSFVILFSVINAFLMQSEKLKLFCFFTEITSAMALTKNIYLISFLLSFGGISIFSQIISVSKNVGVNFPQFLLSRIFCGTVSALFMYILVKISGVSVDVLSNGTDFSLGITENKLSVSISLAVTVILLVISLEGKKIGGNLSDDLLK